MDAERTWTDAERIDVARAQAFRIVALSALALDDPAALLEGLNKRDELESLTELSESVATILMSCAKCLRAVLKGNARDPEDIIWTD